MTFSFVYDSELTVDILTLMLQSKGSIPRVIEGISKMKFNKNNNIENKKLKFKDEENNIDTILLTKRKQFIDNQINQINIQINHIRNQVNQQYKVNNIFELNILEKFLEMNAPKFKEPFNELKQYIKEMEEICKKRKNCTDDDLCHLKGIWGLRKCRFLRSNYNPFEKNLSDFFNYKETDINKFFKENPKIQQYLNDNTNYNYNYFVDQNSIFQKFKQTVEEIKTKISTLRRKREILYTRKFLLDIGTTDNPTLLIFGLAFKVVKQKIATKETLINTIKTVLTQDKFTISVKLHDKFPSSIKKALRNLVKDIEIENKFSIIVKKILEDIHEKIIKLNIRQLIGMSIKLTGSDTIDKDDAIAILTNKIATPAIRLIGDKNIQKNAKMTVDAVTMCGKATYSALVEKKISFLKLLKRIAVLSKNGNDLIINLLFKLTKLYKKDKSVPYFSFIEIAINSQETGTFELNTILQNHHGKML